MKALWIVAALGLILGACSKDPRLAIEAALAAGDRSQASSLLDAALAAQPEQADLHALAYVLAKERALNGPEADKDASLQRGFAEYEWLAGHFGLAKDYTNSDASLRAHAPAQALLEAAGKSLYR